MIQYLNHLQGHSDNPPPPPPPPRPHYFSLNHYIFIGKHINILFLPGLELDFQPAKVGNEIWPVQHLFVLTH